MSRKAWAAVIVCSIVLIGGGVVVAQVVGGVIQGLTSGLSFSSLDGQSSGKKFEEVIVSGTQNQRIVQVFVEGVIATGSAQSALGQSGLSAMSIIAQIEKAVRDDTVRAIVLYVNSPGGTVIASDNIYNALIKAKQAGKKIVVSMGDQAASGGYYIAAPADAIFAHRDTITGSIGVIFRLPNVRKAAEWIGYEEIVIASGALKNMGSLVKPMSDQERQVFRALVDESYATFVNIVAQGRKMSEEQVRTIADGRIYSGAQAKALGLVDAIGTLEDATAFAAKQINVADPQIVRYVAPPSASDVFLDLIGAKSVSQEVLDGLIPQSMKLEGLLYLAQ
jgi:protease-4